MIIIGVMFAATIDCDDTSIPLYLYVTGSMAMCLGALIMGAFGTESGAISDALLVAS